jgi:hypothetical protein
MLRTCSLTACPPGRTQLPPFDYQAAFTSNTIIRMLDSQTTATDYVNVLWAIGWYFSRKILPRACTKAVGPDKFQLILKNKYYI